MDNPTNEELAWAAGFIDGEGHFRLHKTKRSTPDARVYGQAVLTIAQCDRRVLDKIAYILGGIVYGQFPTKKLEWSDVYRYSLWGNTKVRRAIELLLPWLGEIKANQANQAMLEADQISERPRLPMGPKPRISVCHPDRKHGAHGLCESCYSAAYYRRTHAKSA